MKKNIQKIINKIQNKMYNNYDYPAGADTPDAPWNQREMERMKFDIVTTQALERRVTVNTDDYLYEPEFGDYITKETDWKQAYREEHCTLLELIEECKALAQEKLASCKKESERNNGHGWLVNPERSRLERIIRECEGWSTLDEEFEEV